MSGLLGSSSWLPIHAIPPSSMTVSAGIDHTTSSIAPEYSHSGRYFAFLLPRRNHHAKATVAIIVGMMIASMIAVELMRICLFGAADRADGIEDAAIAAGGEQGEHRHAEVAMQAHLPAVAPKRVHRGRSPRCPLVTPTGLEPVFSP